jgi:anti-sigma B factor antagonist
LALATFRQAVRGPASSRLKGLAVPGFDQIRTSLEHRNGVYVLAVAGEIDLATAPAFEEAIAAAMADNPVAFVIDLTDVDFLASAGLQILVEARSKSRTSAGFAVVAHGSATSRPIHLTRLDEYFDLYPTLDEALTALKTTEVRDALGGRPASGADASRSDRCGH